MKKFKTNIIQYVKDEYKFIILIVLLYIILNIPLNYYITIGGGISDVSSRIEVEKKYDSKGSFNISYVEQLPGTVINYLLSYVIPKWERENAGDYKYTDDESLEDIEFRGDLDLITSNGTATYWAYTLAGKEAKETSSKLYVIAKFETAETDLKVQDEILSMDGNHYDNVNDYVNYIQTKKENDIVKMKIKRNGKEQEANAKLHKEKGKILLGIALQYAKTYEVDPKVNINFKPTESGPSGGLITTLEIYNQLTKEDLTHGLKIAGTGTIEFDGTIGPIGGIEHKILGAASKNADLFLVPSGQNYKDALKYKKDKNLKIELVEVKNIQEAIEILEGLK